MMELYCMLVGKTGRAFPVEIDEKKSIANLKDAIKKKKKNDLEKIDADNLELYLAKRGDTWLAGNCEEADALRAGNTSCVQDLLKTELPEMEKIRNVFTGLNDDDVVIHVLVVVPNESTDSGRKRIRDRDWFKENMITKKLKMNQAEQMDTEESVEFYETKYFEMSKFPPMAHPVSEQKKIIERRCYVVIFKQLIEATKNTIAEETQANLVVSGNPGIGKSRFYLYCIYKLIRDQVLVKELPGVQLVINYGVQYHKYCVTSKQFLQLDEAEVNMLQEEENVLRLVEARSTRLVGWKGVSILFSSPGLKEMNDFIKVHPIKYIVPVWSFEELLEYNSILDAKLKLSDDVLVRRYDKYGGIPRFIFEANETLTDTELGDAIGSFTSLSIIRFINADKNARQDKYNHRVLQMVPNNSNFRDTYHLDFLSKHIAEQVVEKISEDSLQKISEFAIAHWNDTSGDTAVLWGRIYEMMCHRKFKLSKDLKFVFRSLMDMSLPDLVIPENLKVVRFDSLADIEVNEIPKESMIYYQPNSGTFGALDAFIMDTNNGKCYGLQMTRNKEHGIKAQPMRTFLQWLGNSFEFYYVFVVPSNIAEQFEKQNFKTEKNTVHQSPGDLRNIAQFVTPFDPFSHRNR